MMKIIKNNSNTTVLYVVFALLLGFFSCVEDEKGDVLFTGDEYENIMQYINANDLYTSFKEVAIAGKMTDALSSYNSNGGDGYTLFLPTNRAISKFIDESDIYASFDEVLSDTEYCAEIVRYHLVNGQIPVNDFPNGALPDKTISNYFLTIFFREENNIVSYSVNDESKVLETDIILSNGIIHTIDKMLTPVVSTSYEWLSQRNTFSIFTELLSKCGLADTLNAFDLDELGREVYNEYTLFAESDEMYAANNIMSFDDLVKVIKPSDDDYINVNNALNKYARYHILEKSVFLDEFGTEVYNTYGNFPVSVDLDDILKINTRSMVFDTLIVEGDTVVVDYLQVKAESSNIVTRSGAIHQLDHLLFPFLPGRKSVTYQFYEEPVLNALRNVEGEHLIEDGDLEFIRLIGTRSLSYVKSTSDIPGNSNNDYIQLVGDVDFSFTTPKILAGRYTLKLVMHRGRSDNASIQTFVDDTKVGVVLDLTKDTQTFRTFTLGTVDFSEYSTHTVKLSTVIPGRMLIDRIIFQPI